MIFWILASLFVLLYLIRRFLARRHSRKIARLASGIYVALLDAHNSYCRKVIFHSSTSHKLHFKQEFTFSLLAMYCFLLSVSRELATGFHVISSCQLLTSDNADMSDFVFLKFNSYVELFNANLSSGDIVTIRGGMAFLLDELLVNDFGFSQDEAEAFFKDVIPVSRSVFPAAFPFSLDLKLFPK